jgi:hypothetical protein
MTIIPLTFKSACEFVNTLHRHHKAPQGHKFSIGLEHEGKLIGVAICGRPVSRHLDNGKTLEVTRLCTDGTKNACSKLYAASRRIAKEMGYHRIITYILESESGISLLAAGWDNEGTAGGGHWSSASRPRSNTSYPTEKKLRYASTLI